MTIKWGCCAYCVGHRRHTVLEQAKTNVGENPETVLADAGYANERDLQALESAGVDGYVALGRESKQQLVEVRSEPARERMRDTVWKSILGFMDSPIWIWPALGGENQNNRQGLTTN